MMPPLSTPRLCLLPIELQDIPTIQSITQDPIFIQASHGCQMPSTEKQLIKWVIAQQRQHRAGHGCCYALRLVDEVNMIGMICIQQEFRAELSYWLCAEKWQQGIMTEAVNCVLNEWLQANPQVALHARCHRNNRASVTLLQKIRMREINVEDQNDEHSFMLNSQN
jgi:[ribosomal protein S5]-alanine N-acetyltransferase